MPLSEIAVIGRNREIGYQNKLIFNIPGDLKRFHEITSYHPVIMGKSTFESIGRVLSNRTNIVLSRDENFFHKNIIIARSIKEAIQKANESVGSEEIFIIGGSSVYAQALPFCDRLYLTVVNKSFDLADAFFPQYENEFKKQIYFQEVKENDYEYNYVTLER